MNTIHTHCVVGAGVGFALVYIFFTVITTEPCTQNKPQPQRTEKLAISLGHAQDGTKQNCTLLT